MRPSLQISSEHAKRLCQDLFADSCQQSINLARFKYLKFLCNDLLILSMQTCTE